MDDFYLRVRDYLHRGTVEKILPKNILRLSFTGTDLRSSGYWMSAATGKLLPAALT